MRRIKKKSSLYSFLDESGLLEKGTEDEIKAARKKYWNEFKRTWRKEKRIREKEFTVSFTKDELKLITNEAKRHRKSIPRYLKSTTLNYIAQRYLVPDEMEVKRISQLLAMNYNVLLQIVEEEKVRTQLGDILLGKISELEKRVLVHLCHSKTLEDWIKQEINKDATLKDKILHMLNSE